MTLITVKHIPATITYQRHQVLDIRGYIGISLLGRTTTWTRARIIELLTDLNIYLITTSIN